MKKKIIVTGGMGFIGSEICKKLLKLNYNVLSIDNLCTNKKSFENLNINIKEDIRSKKIKKIFSQFKPESIIHLAAIHHIPTCEIKRSYALDVNIVGTENILNSASECNVKKFILASSGAVYDWRNEKLRENKTPLNFSDNYSLAKLTNENQCNLWSLRNSSKLSIARIFNTIGPNDPNAHLIPDILNQINNKQDKYSNILLGNTRTKRDYIDVQDTSDAIVRILIKKQLNKNEIFNICSQKEYSVLDIVKNISKILKKKINVKIDKNKIRKIDRLKQLGSNIKIKKELNWHPKVNLQKSISKIIKFHFND